MEERAIITELDVKPMTQQEQKRYLARLEHKKSFTRFILSMVSLMWLIMNVTVFMYWEDKGSSLIGEIAMLILVAISMFAGEYHILFKVWREYIPKIKK